MTESQCDYCCNRTGGTNCIRCFELTLRSLNVVQIHTEGLDKCYTTEEAAMATCPTDESIATGKSREIMLYSESPSFFLAPLLPSLEKLPPFADSFPVRSSSNAFLPYRNQRIERRSSRRPRVLPNQWPVCFHLFRQWRIDRSRQHWWKCQRMSRTRLWIIKLPVRLRIGAPLQTLLFRRSRYN